MSTHLHAGTHPRQVRSGLLSPLLLLGAALSCVTPQAAEAKGGFGVHLGLLGGTNSSGFASSATPFIGAEGLTYLNLGPGRRLGHGPQLRLGGELNGLFSRLDGNGASGGVFLDVVVHRVANADIFVGMGLGLAGGQTLTGPYAEGPGLYARPELGALWNLGRLAVTAKLEATLLPGDPSSATTEAGRVFGVNVGVLFGDFPLFDRKGKVDRQPKGPPPPPRGPGRPGRPGRKVVVPPVPPPPR